MRDFEVKIAEQERRTADLIGGVFSNLSGVLSGGQKRGDIERGTSRRAEGADGRDGGKGWGARS